MVFSSLKQLTVFKIRLYLELNINPGMKIFKGLVVIFIMRLSLLVISEYFSSFIFGAVSNCSANEYSPIPLLYCL